MTKLEKEIWAWHVPGGNGSEPNGPDQTGWETERTASQPNMTRYVLGTEFDRVEAERNQLLAAARHVKRMASFSSHDIDTALRDLYAVMDRMSEERKLFSVGENVRIHMPDGWVNAVIASGPHDYEDGNEAKQFYSVRLPVSSEVFDCVSSCITSDARPKLTGGPSPKDPV